MSIVKERFEVERARSGDRPKFHGIVPVALALVLMVVLYYGTMTWWVFEWTRAGSFYAHGIFIPFFVALMIWRDRERLKRLPMERCWWGMSLVVFAVALVLLAERAQVTVPVSISFILFLIGSILVVAGKRVTRALLFPLLFLFTMIPIVPDQLINPIAFPIQMTSAKMAASICNLIGFPAERIGTLINMEHYRLDVELPCSGFKTLLGLLSFSAAFAYVVEAEAWKRWLLFTISAPLAILVNGIRITLIGLVGEVFGGHAANTFHDYSGFIVLILGFTFLFNFARALRCDNFLGVPLNDGPTTDGEKDRAVNPKDTAKEAAAEGLVSGAGNPSETDRFVTARAAQAEKVAASQEAFDLKWGRPRSHSLRYVGAGLFPIIAVLLLAVVAKPAITAPRPPIAAVMSQDVAASLSAGEWTQSGKDVAITPEVKSALNPISYINRYYSGHSGGPALVEMLLTAGNGRKVFHDPHTCFLGSGYDMRDVRVETIQSPMGPLTVQVAEAESVQDHTKTLSACFQY